VNRLATATAGQPHPARIIEATRRRRFMRSSPRAWRRSSLRDGCCSKG